VNGDVTRNHYDRLAATYDENWAYSPEFVKWMTDHIVRRLRISDGDLIADIGCGTGLYARGLAERAATVVCAEPSEAMLAQVPRGELLMAVQASAEDMAAGRALVSHDGYAAILLKEVLHHVADPAAVIAGLAGLLKAGGRILVVMLPAKISYPLFAAALKLFEERQPDPADIAEAMRGARLKTTLTQESFPLSFPAERYLQMVRNRYMSLLSSFDDAELEAGVAEIKDAHPGERIEFTDTFAFVLGTKA
jgi:2-polyprenyl-3-methyl-5-hydroxy-6-metoxy-1,4-benzoquinol methylase